MKKSVDTLERDRFLNKQLRNEGIVGRSSWYSTWQGFGELWEWAIKQEWWLSFGYRHGDVSLGQAIFSQYYINPDRFADAVYEYLREREVVDG